MNLETKIKEELWLEIRRSYAEERYSDAIKDAIMHLSEMIRSKSGADSDGVALVGQAFDGAVPRIRVTKLESESDRNVQSGISAILRGVYQAFRNPRAHGKIEDSVAEAEAIILFIDYLIGVIGKSKAQFSMTDCLNTVYDDAFVPSQAYSELVVSEIPPKHRSSVFIEAFEARDRGDANKSHYFFHALFKSMTVVELAEALGVISKALRTLSREDYARVIAIVRPEDWKNLDPIARLRAENLILETIENGEYSEAKSRCTSGGMGTWAREHLKHFSSKDRVFSVLLKGMLSDSKAKRAYVCRFMPDLDDFKEKPDTWHVKQLIGALDSGNSDAFAYLQGLTVFGSETDPWIEPFKEAVARFEAKEETPESLDEDVPF
jgi:uncharacterized protein (TIGR02391 family)